MLTRQPCSPVAWLVAVLALFTATCTVDQGAADHPPRAPLGMRMRPRDSRRARPRARSLSRSTGHSATPPGGPPELIDIESPPLDSLAARRGTPPPAPEPMPDIAPMSESAPTKEQDADMGSPREQASPAVAPKTSPPPTPPAPPDGEAPPPLQQPMGPEEGDLRLVAQREINGYVFGGLQIYLDGAFGAVCGAKFWAADADVACRQLGFIGGGFVPSPTAAFSDAEIREVAVPIVLEGPDCLGTEDRLLDCPITGLDPYGFYGDYNGGASSCQVLDDAPGINNAYVACGSASGPEDGQIRLVGGATSEDGLSQFGRLEYANAGGWGNGCDPGAAARFFAADARVACRSLGFAEGIPIRPGVRSGPWLPPFPHRDLIDETVSLLPNWLSGPGCVGNESSLLDCPDSERGLTLAAFCSARSYLELSCFSGPNPELDGRLRLMGGGAGPGYEYGRLEIFIRGFWSTVCDEAEFTPNAAQVACRALGFEDGAAIQDVTEAALATSSLPPGISRVDCNGTETSLLECTSSKDFGFQGECRAPMSSASDATVLVCADASTDCDIEPAEEQGSVRLVGGFGTPCDPLHSGIVEVLNAGDWGAICDGGLVHPGDDPIADVVCRQLGFPHGSIVSALTALPDINRVLDYLTAGDLFEEAEEPQERFWLPRDVECQGTEQRLVDCDLGAGFVPRAVAESGAEACSFDGGGPDDPPARVHVACTQFAVV